MITKNLDKVLKCHDSAGRKYGCYGEVGYHGTHVHQNYCLGLNHMENEVLDRERETGLECL